MAEVLASLIRLNLVASAAIILVMLLRSPLRRLIGPKDSYAAWLLVPLSLLGACMPAPQATGPVGVFEEVGHGSTDWIAASGDAPLLLVGVWLAGVIAGVVIVWRFQVRFHQEERAGRAGPAVTGLLSPRLVAPSNFRDLYTSEEQRLVRAHERTHLDRHDTRLVALVVVCRCIAWFNPLVHLAAARFKLDQELACDATVLDRYPNDRRAYARALVGAQEKSETLVLGCRWRAKGRHPLVVRVALIAGGPPRHRREEVAAILLPLLFLAIFVTGWCSQPPNRAMDLHPVFWLDKTARPYAAPATGVWRIAFAPG